MDGTKTKKVHFMLMVLQFSGFNILMYLTVGASSVMVARGALWNVSIFSPKGKIPWENVKREYVRKVICLLI